MAPTETPGGLKIVTVDDSPVVIQRLQQMLGELDEVVWVANATRIEEAMSLIEKTSPNMAILDISLAQDAPRANGIDLLKILRRDQPLMTIIMLTNLAGDEYRTRCMDLGADYFLDKALDFERIPELIRSLSRIKP